MIAERARTRPALVLAGVACVASAVAVAVAAVAAPPPAPAKCAAVDMMVGQVYIPGCTFVPVDHAGAEHALAPPPAPAKCAAVDTIVGQVYDRWIVWGLHSTVDALWLELADVEIIIQAAQWAASTSHGAERAGCDEALAAWSARRSDLLARIQRTSPSLPPDRVHRAAPAP